MWRKGMLQRLEDLTKHDFTQLRTVAALHNAIAIALPLLVGLATAHTLSGLGIAIGALVAAFAAMKGTLRKRLRTMLLVSIWMGGATLVGTLSGGITWLTVILIVTSGFLAGILNSVSATAGQIGLLSTNIFIIVSQSSQDPIHAFYSALLVMTGGLLQALLMVISDLLSRSDTETTAVSSVYAAIANYAMSLTRKADLQVASSLLEVDACLNDSWIRKDRWQELHVLADLAELIRIDIVTLTRMMKGVQNQSVFTSDDVRAMNAPLHVVSSLLMSVATLMSRGKSSGHEGQVLEGPLTELGIIVHDMASSTTSGAESDTYICLHQLYSKMAQVVDILNLEVLDQAYVVAYAPHRSPSPKLHRVFIIIRANLTFRSALFRHAVRLAVALAIASVIYRELTLPLGYWLPLTTGIVLRPEFFSTFARGIARMLGTVLGVLVATLLTMVPDSSHLLDMALIILFAWAMYTVVNFNYALFSFFLTSEIVMLLSFFEHSSPFVAMTARVTDTGLGCLLALFIYILWPTWQRQNVSSAIANWISAVRTYFQSVMAYAPHSSAQVQKYRKQARLARTNAVSVVDQFMLEPVRQTLDAYAVEGVVTAFHRFSETLLSVESRVGVEQHFRSNPAVVMWVDQMDHALAVIENLVRDTNSSPSSVHFDPPIVEQIIVDLEPTTFYTLALLRLQETMETVVRMLPMIKSRHSQN